MVFPFPEFAPEADAVGLAKQLASEAQSAELRDGGGSIIFGPGGKAPLIDSARLAVDYGGNPSDWVKIRSSNFKAADGVSFETHAYKNIQTGQVVELKTKFQ